MEQLSTDRKERFSGKERKELFSGKEKNYWTIFWESYFLEINRLTQNAHFTPFIHHIVFLENYSIFLRLTHWPETHTYPLLDTTPTAKFLLHKINRLCKFCSCKFLQAIDHTGQWLWRCYWWLVTLAFMCTDILYYVDSSFGNTFIYNNLGICEKPI